MARQNGWFVKRDKTDLVEPDGFQQSALEYPGLSKDAIFEAVGPLLPRLLPAPQAHPAHHQDHARRQGSLRPPAAARASSSSKASASARRIWPPPEVAPQHPRRRECDATAPSRATRSFPPARAIGHSSFMACPGSLALMVFRPRKVPSPLFPPHRVAASTRRACSASRLEHPPGDAGRRESQSRADLKSSAP